jgi:hypothetical protein
VDPRTLFEDPTGFVSSHGSMNHIAFDVSPDKFDEYHKKLSDKGVDVSPVMRHDTSPAQVAEEVTEKVWVSSLYFQDPDGILLEFACWHHTAFDAKLGHRWDHTPATPADRDKYRKMGEEFAKEMAEKAAE